MKFCLAVSQIVNFVSFINLLEVNFWIFIIMNSLIFKIFHFFTFHVFVPSRNINSNLTYLFKIYFEALSQIMMKSALLLLIALVFAASPGFSASSTSFTYDNPQKWEGNCQKGSIQSPIDIRSNNLELCPNIKTKFRYLNVSNPLVSEDYSFTVTTNGAGYIGVEDNIGTGPRIRLYDTKQFHFHVPSEHTINGQSYPLEIHNFFVAMDRSEGLKLVSSNEFKAFSSSKYHTPGVFAAVLSYLFYPSDAANAIDLNVKTDANGVAQVNRLQIFGNTTSKQWYHYRGSTTAPPCTQTVDWFVYRQPLPIKTSNYNAIKAGINNGKPNARPTQRLNGRKVYVVGEQCPKN